MAEEFEQGEKTEAATPRRRQEAREKGQVALSSELVVATMLSSGLGLLLLAGGGLANAAGGLVAASLSGSGQLGVQDLALPDLTAVIEASGRSVLGSLVLVVLPLLAIGLLAGYGQVGFRLAPKALALELSKISPLKGFKRLVSARSVVRTLLAALKILVIVTVVVAVASSQLSNLWLLAGGDLGPALAGLGAVLLRCTAGALVAIIVLAVADMLFQRWQHERDLRMSKQEVREDTKVTEGDPHIKARVRRIQRELASRRMMAEVPEATVVVTNPTHVAVALKYERDEDGATSGAPRVVAKGVDHVAQRIKEIAREANVPLFEDVFLARSLNAQVEIGEEIPEALYEAVASVLAYVYRVQGEKVAV